MFLLDAAVSPAGAHQAADDGARELIITASDVVLGSRCEYQLLRICDEKLGRAPKAQYPEEEMRNRAGRLGDRHEQRVLQRLRSQYPNVVEIDGVASYGAADLSEAHRATVRAMRDGADVVFQASFFDGVFHGRADFLVRSDDGRYAVWDSKLARSAKTEALLQLAAYAHQVEKAGIAVSPQATLVLGDDRHVSFPLAELLPVYYERLDRVRTLLAEHRGRSEPVIWGDDAVLICGRCDYCAEQVALHQDVLGVHRVSLPRRRKLRAQGIVTITDLATAEAEPGTTAQRLREQARMQAGLERVDGTVQVAGPAGPAPLSYKVLADNTLSALPDPSPGDVFFDFEGDPLWQDAAGVWGLEYLFGVLEAPVGNAPGVFRPFLAHSRAEEGRALEQFLDYVNARRERYPDLHVYHYAAYERSALQRLSVQHGVGEDAVDELLRERVLVDLYDVVQTSLRLSTKSYGLKALEPLYMGDDLRSGDVTDGGASVVAYANYCQAVENGEHTEAREVLDSILDYNHYDCRSTLGLREWLTGLAAQRGQPIGQRFEPETDERAEPQAPPQEVLITEHLRTRPGAGDDPDTQALAMVAAAVRYHRREAKQFWWGHFDRLETPFADWAHTRDVFIVDSARVVDPWTRRGGSPRRRLELTGTLADGSLLRESSSVFRMYDRPLPQGVRDFGTRRSGMWGGEIVEIDPGVETSRIVLDEPLPRAVTQYDSLPVALTPPSPIATTSIENALLALAELVAAELPDLPAHPGLDLLRRRPPRLSTHGGLPQVRDGDYVAAITEATRRLDNSYLAVQGPPGSGKTYVGARVIRQLVQAGWKVGVVAQSHAVVENLLHAALDAGVPADVVAKPSRAAGVRWQGGTTNEHVTAVLAAPGGALIGGTAWTMTGRAVPPGSLDLLVIDEAGQFSIANTLAVTRATTRLLLLGDPQQLPQVSQGSHPEPIDLSALGWLSHDAAVLPAHLGYFLAQTWRMHPALCRAVSDLAYDGRLRPAPVTGQRELIGKGPGIETRFVSHAGNTTASEEEALEVLAQVRAHLGLPWRSGTGAAPRPLGHNDVLVVAPYNAQVQLIADTLAAAGLADVRVGTVDKFQGQQAPVVIVSTTVSAAQEAPRGLEFVLNRNRINVAVSRGMWRAVIVRSLTLTDALPWRPEQLTDLGAFIRLCGPAPSNPSGLPMKEPGAGGAGERVPTPG